MRIGLDARLAGPGLGIATMLRALATGLASSGEEVVWFGDSKLAPEGVFDAVAPPPGFPALDSAWGHRVVARQHVDLMHFAGNSGWWSRGPVPHVLTVHDVMWSTSSFASRRVRQVIGHRYLRFAVPRALQGATRVAVPSATTAAALVSRYGNASEVIHNGVAEEWRAAQAVPAADPYIVAFAGRDPRKGTEVVVATWAVLRAKGVRLVLLAGAGLSPGLERRLAQLAPTGGIEVLPYQPTPRLAKIVAGSVALLYPSTDEGFGLPVIEAMAAGVPVIAGLTPVTREIGGDALMLLDPDDPVGTGSRIIEQLLDDADLRCSVASRGREQADGFTWNAATERYRALYRDVLVS
jgi:glycosyltransferase involved in cell wall biosynthesis